jgi:hypothetical protein
VLVGAEAAHLAVEYSRQVHVSHPAFRGYAATCSRRTVLLQQAQGAFS